RHPEKSGPAAADTRGAALARDDGRRYPLAVRADDHRTAGMPAFALVESRRQARQAPHRVAEVARLARLGGPEPDHDLLLVNNYVGQQFLVGAKDSRGPRHTALQLHYFRGALELAVPVVPLEMA